MFARLRSLWRGARQRETIEAGMREEFEQHIALRARDLERSGVDAAAALRQARLDFGSIDHYRAESRASRGMALLDRFRFSWLDVKLGFRMLARYPGLTLVGGISIAFAICAGATMFEVVTQMVRPRLPFPEGERVVGLRMWDAEQQDPESRIAMEFLEWRGTLRTVTELGAARTVERNVAFGTEIGEPISYAEMTASGFGITRVPPLLGRPLLATDEHPGAPDVVVLGYDIWREQFAGDSGVIGRRILVGQQTTEIVGVMPEGFAFPASHRMWMPLRLQGPYAPRQGPWVVVFGRLAPGSSMADAQAELTVYAQRAALDYPQTHRHLRADVRHYPRSLLDVQPAEAVALMSSNLVAILLLLLICANVALLMFARAASRETEIAVRTALGASRNRIVGQMFAEALVLGGIAAIIGITAAGATLEWLNARLGVALMGSETRPPFWLTATLSPVTIVYATVLALLGSAVAGILPALRITKTVSATLKETSGGAAGLRFAGIWTFVIVAQVALTVALPAVSFLVKRDQAAMRDYNAGIRLTDFSSAALVMEQGDAPVAPDSAFFLRYATVMADFERRLRDHPAVEDVAWASRLPRMTHFPQAIEVQGGTPVPVDSADRSAAPVHVGINYFDVLEHPITRGRAFHAGDLGANSRAVIVNEQFVRDLLGGANPIGRLVRYAVDSVQAPWFEIVGVSDDLGTLKHAGPAPAIYHPVPLGFGHPFHVLVRLRGDAASFGHTMRQAAASVDPSLRLVDVLPLTEVISGEYKYFESNFRMVLSITVVALVLSLAGIYAVMSFTVARRTREIGMRVALGGSALRVLLAIFARPLRQVTLGVVIGCVLAGTIAWRASDSILTMRGALVVAMYGVLMLGVCLLACVIPTRRALAVEPTEALRSSL